MEICAPFAGIVHYVVTVGEHVDTGQELGSVEAVKLEAPILAPGPGVVAALHKENYADVIGGEALLRIEEA